MPQTADHTTKPEDATKDIDQRLLVNTPAAEFVDTLSDFGRLLTATYHKRTPLTPNQTGIIAALVASDGQTQTELAQALQTHKVSIGIYLSELEAMMLIERRPHPSDGRAKCAYLTELLKDNIKHGRKAMLEVHNIAIEGISKSDYETMMKCMKQMHANLVVQEKVDAGLSPAAPYENADAD